MYLALKYYYIAPTVYWSRLPDARRGGAGYVLEHEYTMYIKHLVAYAQVNVYKWKC